MEEQKNGLACIYLAMGLSSSLLRASSLTVHSHPSLMRIPQCEPIDFYLISSKIFCNEIPRCVTPPLSGPMCWKAKSSRPIPFEIIHKYQDHAAYFSTDI